MEYIGTIILIYINFELNGEGKTFLGTFFNRIRTIQPKRFTGRLLYVYCLF